jgi:fumarate hydratase class II
MGAMKTRIEKDSMGEMRVPEDALYGASTQRAVENFPISGQPLPRPFLRAVGLIKEACACANEQLGLLPAALSAPIRQAAREVADGTLDAHFPVDVYQTGSATSTNMNANEVIANLANQRLGIGLGAKGQKGAVHPNDQVNMGQSSNDTFPAAMHIAGAVQLKERMLPALTRMAEELAKKAEEWDSIVKIGRTHLMDATPIRMGQVFSGYAAQAHYATIRGGRALARLEENMPIGGTAVGTGINTHSEFAARVCAAL